MTPYATCIVALLWAGSALAQGSPAPASPAGDESPQAGAQKAANDAPAAEAPSGLRSSLPDPVAAELKQLTDAGVKFDLQEQSELWASLIGGGRRGVSYNGLTTAKLDIDLDKAAGWTGAEFVVNAYDIHAHGPTRSLVGNLQIVSSIEAAPSVKLYDLWLDQSFFEKRLSVRVGQEGASDEFMITQYGTLFLNAAFGLPGMAATILPSGGPSYPLATPFARMSFQATDNLNLVGGVYNGDPAPPGVGDPQIRDRNGTAFRLDDHTLGVAEIWYSPDPGASHALPTTYKLGAFYASNRFADQRVDSAGGLLANPAGTGRALQHAGDWAIYGVIDQMIWRRPGTKDEGIGVFLHAMAGPSDRNLSDRFIEGGVNWRAPFDGRPDDALGLALSYLGISPAARQFSRDLVAFGGALSAYAAAEVVVEATYVGKITNWLTLQPDLQLILNPGAGIPGPFGRMKLADAIVIGTRATIKF